jgi:hypothetical protein
VRAYVGRGARGRIKGAKMVICNDYEFELIRQKTGLGEDEIQARLSCWSSPAVKMAARFTNKKANRCASGAAARNR